MKLEQYISIPQTKITPDPIYNNGTQIRYANRKRFLEINLNPETRWKEQITMK